MYQVTVIKEREYGMGFIPTNYLPVKLTKAQLRDWCKVRRNTSGFVRNTTVAGIINAPAGKMMRYGCVSDLHFIITRI